MRVHSITSASSCRSSSASLSFFLPLAENEDVAFQRGGFPGNLRAVRGQAHVEAHALEGVLDAGVALRQLAHQVLGVEAVLPLAVGGDVAGRGGIGQQAADRGVELRQALLLGPVGAAEGIVAAGIEDDDEGLVLRRAELAQQQAEVDAALLDVLLLSTTASTGSR
jgi:hypothetical protein